MTDQGETMEPQEYTLVDSRHDEEYHFTGYRLGTATVRHGKKKTPYTAYFDVGEKRMLVIQGGKVRGHVQEYEEEYNFLSYFGVALTYPLVWAPGGEDIPEVVAWFEKYEGWGC